jgi:arylsulfatase A-like enzyme
MRSRRILLLGVLLGACTSDPPTFDMRHLADDLAGARGGPTPVERVNGVMRVTLPGLYSVALLPPTPNTLALDPSITKHQLKTPSVRTDILLPAASRLSFAADGQGTDVSFVCPDKLADRPAVLTTEPADPSAPHLAQPFRCSPAADGLVHVHSAAPLTPETVLNVRGLETERVEADPHELQPGARLRVALGLVPAVTTGHPGAATFRISARLDPATRPEDAAWVLVEQDLEPVRRALGPNVHLIFEVQTGNDGESSFPIWGDPTIVSPRAASAAGPSRRNVVLISIDTLRADRVGAYGSTRPTTPTLDALAARSTVFDTVVAPAPWTLPSHTSMMTGLQECVHGMVGYVGLPFPPGLVPLAQRLREAGYATAATTEDGFLDAAAFLRGFGYYWEAPSIDDRVPQTVAQAQEWLRTEATEPFFLFFHTYQTHDPYFSPPGYADLVTAGGSNAGAPQLVTYDAAVRYTDDTLAPLLAAIEARPRGDRTLLIVTSDHGEAFGEHGYTGHGRTLHEEVLRVPLFMWGPGLIAPGRRVPGLAGVIDVTPTILDLLGMDAPHDVTGISLAPQVRTGGMPPPLPDRLLYSENMLQDTYRLSARGADWKASWEGDTLTIVDLVHDPGERGSAQTPERTAAADAARRRFEEDCRRQRAELDSAGASLPAPPPHFLDPEREKRLRALGYAQ